MSMTHEPGVGKRGRSVSEEGGGWQVVSAELVIAGNKPTGSRGLSPSLSVSAVGLGTRGAVGGNVAI